MSDNTDATDLASGGATTCVPPSRPGLHGSDVDPDGSGTVSDQRTYQLIRQTGPIADPLFEVEFLAAGVEAHCFTFG
jgi:Thioredoxin like C-terminal domain